MTPQELKYSIICTALQGMLVKQDEAEIPVDLCTIKQKKTEEFEFDIPEKWKVAHLETVTNGIPAKQYQILESEVQQMGKHPVISQSKAYSIGFSDNFDKVFHHIKPVIVFGDHTTEVKYVDFDFIVGADGVKIFEPIDEIVTASFLFYVFLFYSKDLSKVGGYSRHYKYIKNKPIPLPPLSEQKRIVAKIEELLPLIDRYEQAWSKLEEFNKRFPVDMQKSILQTAIQGKLVEQRQEEGTGEELYQQIQAEKQSLIKAGKIKKEKPLPEIIEDEILFDIPESWKWVRLGKIVKKLTDGSHNPPPNTGRGYPVISAKNVKNGLITFENVDRYTDEKGFEKENPRTNISKGDIILGIIGGSIGNIAVYTHNEKVIAQRSIAIMTTMVDTEYFISVLKSPLIQNAMQSAASGSAQGGVYLGTLSNFLVPLPPLAEQKRIVAKLEEILPLCERLK